MARTIRVLSIMEAAFVSDPAKNLIEFARRARAAEQDLPALEYTLATYQRGREESPNAFVEAARSAGIPVDIVYERGRVDFFVLFPFKAIRAGRDPRTTSRHI